MIKVIQNEKINLGLMKSMWLMHAQNNPHLNEQRFDEIVTRLSHVIELLGGDEVRLSEVTPEKIEELKSNLLKMKNRKTGVAWKHATVNRSLAVLKAAINLVIDRNISNANPFETIPLIRENNERTRICSREEYLQIIEVADLQTKFAVMIAYYTSLRLGEILHLTWSDIDLNDNVIKVTKGGKNTTYREIPIHHELKSFLQKKAKIGDQIFFDSVSNQSLKFNRLCKRLHIENLCFHDLRHTCLTNLRRRGVDILTLQKISGHRSMSMLARYVHVGSDEVKNAIDLL